ncbi:MAG TPA: exonuclease domain-containing protein [Lentisphaeria bacterium]|nr:exonuclease domain-containing protein [Lentisphaeria bacterium]
MILAGLDFETANPCNGSICAAGATLLQDGQGIAEREWLIRPHPTLSRFFPGFISIHGIYPEDVQEAPEFWEIWPSLAELLVSADCVIIHNASFDLRHLRAVLELYAAPPVSFSYACSLQISRRCFPQLQSHSLSCVASHIGHHVFHHHNALEDAVACAKIVACTGLPSDCLRQFVYAGEPRGGGKSLKKCPGC